MKTSDLGKKKGVNYHPTPPYGMFEASKQDKQGDDTFQSNGNRKKFKDSQDLMGGPEYRNIAELSPSERSNYAKKKLEEVAMKSFGRYHE